MFVPKSVAALPPQKEPADKVNLPLSGCRVKAEFVRSCRYCKGFRYIRLVLRWFRPPQLRSLAPFFYLRPEVDLCPPKE